MTKPLSNSTIIAAYAWPHSLAHLVAGFRLLGKPTTPEHIIEVWNAAKARGDLPPGDRPSGGFDQRESALVQALRLG